MQPSTASVNLTKCSAKSVKDKQMPKSDLLAITSKAKVSKMKSLSTNSNNESDLSNEFDGSLHPQDRSDILEQKVVKLVKPKLNNNTDTSNDLIMSDSDDNNHINSLDKFINKKKTVKVITKITKTKTTKSINHEVVKYKDSEYVVCCIPFKDEHKLFVVDIDQKDQVINKNWNYRSDGSYISSSVYVDDNKKELYLHNFVMDKLTFDGKGQQHTIDHISRVGTDNRKENLKNVESQSAQNFNQKRRERKTELPEDCGIELEQIPKNVYYAKPCGLHGEFFYIELKGIPVICLDGKKYLWKTTKSKSVDLKIKLQQVINKLIELKNTYPELKNVIFDEESDEIREALITDYNNILKKSHYPIDVINTNLRGFNGDYTDTNIIDQNELDVVQQVQNVEKIKNAGKKTDNLPDDCGITMNQIPKYCYFRPESDKRGCKFIIERHPKLIEQGTRQWTTTESKKISIQDKFKSLIDKLNELNCIAN